MENSIEETKKQLELILKARKEQKEIIECAGGWCINCDPDIKALTESIYILKDYKRVLKENEYLKEKWDKDTHRLQNYLDVANADKIDLIQQNEELRHKVAGQLCVIETQAHNEEVYEKLVMKLEKENTELKEVRKSSDEFYEEFTKSNRKNRDLHDGGLYFDGKVSALQELLEKE